MSPTRTLLGLSLAAACGGGEPTVRVCAGGAGEHATIAAAVAAAPPGSRIEICAGTYAERLDLAGRRVQLVGAGPGTTVIDAGGAGRAITIAGGEVTLEELTIRGGLAEQGGGISAVDAALALRRVELRDNRATGQGGALYLSADAVIEESVLAGNEAGWTGGAVYVDGHAPVLRANTIESNLAAWEGGAIYLHQSAATLTDNRIANNRAEDDGGGLRIFESEALLERNRIVGNLAGSDGGGLKSSHLPSRFVDNLITGNQAEGAGGGLELDNDASVVVGGEVSGNQASLGGGIHVQLAAWDGARIEEVRIADNRAWRGGGIALEDDFVPVTVSRVIVAGNLAGQGGGIYQRGGHLVLANAVIAGNQAYEQGGGLYLAASAPWDEPCPCPPANPPVDIAFVVLYGNAAEWGDAIWTDAPEVSIDSAIVARHDGVAVVAAPGRAPRWRYVDTHPATFAGMDDPTGRDGNLAAEPRLVAPDAGDFRLAGGSVCIDAGNPAFVDPDGSRADMGAHAGPGAP